MKAVRAKDEPSGGRAEIELRIPEDIQKILKTGPFVKWKGQSADVLLERLWDLVLHLDLGATLVWKRLSPDSSDASKEVFAETISKTLAGKTEVSAQEFETGLQCTKGFVSALLLAISGKGCDGFEGGVHKFAVDFESKFRPEKIRDDAALEKTWHEPLDSTCWRRYQKLAENEEVTAEKIEFKLKRALAEEAAFWMKAHLPPEPN